jgi:hypothetical protein
MCGVFPDTEKRLTRGGEPARDSPGSPSPRAPRPVRRRADPEVLGGRGGGAPTAAHARRRALPAELLRAARLFPGGAPSRAAAAAANMAETSEEVAVLVQRVVKDITNAFRRNPHM